MLGSTSEGKDFCSGNHTTTLPLSFTNSLALSLYYNSQIYPFRRGFREAEGFSKGWTAFARVEVATANRIVLRSSDGSYTSYNASGRGQWRSEHWIRGHLSLFTRNTAGHYVLEEADGSQSTFGQQINSYSYITEMRAPSGLTTTITYRDNAPAEIRNSQGEFLRFTCTAGVCSRVVDNNGVGYQLSYTGNKLVRMTSPESVNTEISYTNAVGDAETLIAAISDSRYQTTTTYAYFNHGVLRAVGDGKLTSVFSYSPSEVTKTLIAAGNDKDKEFMRWSYTRLASGPWVTEVRTGDGAPESNPGIATTTIARLSDGRVSVATTANGEAVQFFYAEGSNRCDPRAAQTAPVPSCVVTASGSRTTTTFADNRYYAPSTISFSDPQNRPIQTVRYSWMPSTNENTTSTIRAGQPLSMAVLVAGQEVSRTDFSYQSSGGVSLPRMMTTTTLEQLQYDSAVRGRLASITTSSGDRSTVRYDAIGRLSSVTKNGETVGYTYDTQSNGSVTIVATGPSATLKKTTDFRGLAVNQEVRYTNVSGTQTKVVSQATSQISPNNQTAEQSTIVSQNGGTYTHTSIDDHTRQQNGSFKNTTIENDGDF
jgi:YD repeat-containing protein